MNVPAALETCRESEVALHHVSVQQGKRPAPPHLVARRFTRPPTRRDPRRLRLWSRARTSGSSPFPILCDRARGDVYAHLGTVRHRSDVVEFRIEQHLEALKDRLGNVGFVTRNVTTERAGAENETPTSTEVEAGEVVPEWARRDSNARPLAPERRPDRQPPPEGAEPPS